MSEQASESFAAEQVRAIYQKTFNNLSFLYRDTELADDSIACYQVGQILQEPGFVDVSYKGGGLSTNFRYLIATGSAKDLSAFNPEAKEFGHVVLTANSYFKVLDISIVDDKTQVFLLEIPEAAVDFFATTTSNVEEQIVQSARENFSEKVNEEPVPELLNPMWIDRTSTPIGMNDENEFFFRAGVSADIPSKSTASSPKGEPKKRSWWKFW